MLGEALVAVAQGTTAIMELLQKQADQRGERQHHTTLQQFLAIGPPRFAEARDPLEADDWLAEIKKHFKANTVREEDYVTFTSFQLQGAAGSWYSTYKDNKGDTEITWDDFVKDFRAAHIPSGLIERKREEFLALRQGDRTVQEYNLAFVRLARYATEEVSTEAKRIARFRGGLATDIKYALTLSNPALFSEFVDQAIRQESAEAERSADKRKQREFSSAVMVHKKAKSWVPDPQPQRQQFQQRGQLSALLPALPSQFSRALALLHPSRCRLLLRASPGLRSAASSVASRGTSLRSAPIPVSLGRLRLHLALHRAMRWCGPSHEELE